MPSYLNEVPLHISPAVNLNLTESVGINKSTGYFGLDRSFTGMHPEDGNLDSCNGCHCGLGDNSVKVWIFVIAHHRNRFAELLANLVKQAKKKNNRMFPGHDMGCLLILGHKNNLVTIDFLKRHSIEFEVVIQRPGDIIYVAPGIYHQVINFGVTYAEAVNVGGSAWNHSAYLYSPCIYKGKNVEYIEPNDSGVHQVSWQSDHQPTVMPSAEATLLSTPANNEDCSSSH